MRVVRSGRLLFLLTMGLFVAWFLLLRPGSLGGPASYVMVTGSSMERTLHTGDLAMTRKQDSYAIGDIVAFRVPKGEPAEGAMVIHRIVGGSAAEGYVVQGDNNNAPDPWRPKPQNIVGHLWFTLPGAARWVWLLRQPLILGALAGAFGMFMVLSGSEWHAGLSIPGRRRRPADRGSGEG